MENNTLKFVAGVKNGSFGTRNKVCKFSHLAHQNVHFVLALLCLVVCPVDAVGVSASR